MSAPQRCLPSPPPPAAVAWEEWEAVLRPTGPALRPGQRVLVVTAHPDDESIGAGRLLAGHDGPVTVVTLSAGESCVVDDQIDPLDMAAQRLAEWRAAVCELGADAVECERWPDSELSQHESAITEAVLGLARSSDVLVSTWQHDPHPDHQGVGRACSAAATMLGLGLVEFPVWAPYWMAPGDVDALGQRLAVLAGTPKQDAAWLAAISCYPSQTLPLRPGRHPVVPTELLARHERQLIVRPHG